MSKQFTGTAYLTLDGARIPTVPASAKLNPGGVTRTPIVVDGGFIGFSETPTHSEIECEVVMSADVDIMKINAATDMTIMFQADSGENYVVRGAAAMEPLKHEAGKTAAKFFGAKAERI